MAVVVSIHRVAKWNQTAIALEAARFEVNFGLEGDWRSRKGSQRQITLIENEALEDVARVPGIGKIAPGASRRQIVVSGIALNQAVGKHLRVGSVLVAVKDLCDPCKNMEDKIGPGAQAALADRGGVCGRVIEGGIVRPGDAVIVVD